MKQSFGQKGAGGRFLALVLALIMLCSVLPMSAYAAAVDEPVSVGVTYIFHVGETEYHRVKVLSGEALTKPADPAAEEGKVFAGWRLADGQEFTSFGTAVSTTQDETVSLYAHFAEAQPANEAPAEPAEENPAQEPAAETKTEEIKTEETKTEETKTEETKTDEGVTGDENAAENTENPTPVEPTPAEPVEPTPAEPVPTEPQPAEGEPTEGEPAEGEQQTVYTTDAQTAEELYARLMAATSLEEMNSLLDNLTEEQNALMDEFTEEQNAALEAKMAEFGAYEISTLANPSSITIVRDETKTVSLNKSSNASISFSGTAVSAGIQVEATNNNKSIQISAGDRVLPGTYTLTVSWGNVQWQQTDTVTITVTANGKEEDVITKAEIYFMKNPDGNASDNATSTWSDALPNPATVKLYGANWQDVKDTNGNVLYKDKNLFEPADYIVSMPDDMTDMLDGSYALPYDGYRSYWKAIFDTYKNDLQTKYPDARLNSEADFEAVYLTPFKISRNNGGDYPVHIDCTVTVVLPGYFNVEFLVTLPNGYQPRADSNRYKEGSKIPNTTKAPKTTEFPLTWTDDDGTKYSFVGWKNEEGELIAWDDETKWPYTPTEKELEDKVVRFEAWYVLEDVTLTVTKEVDGNFVETGGKFQFAYEYDGENQQKVTETFELEAGKSTQITIPSGTQVTVRETTTGYTTSWSYTYKDGKNKTQVVNSTSNVDVKECTLTMTADTTLTFVNARQITPDTGILLDSLPYVLILGVVAAGAVLLAVRRRRHDVD